MTKSWIASGLAMLCADRRGRVSGGRVVFDHAVRAALVIDLALRDRLSSDMRQRYVDTSPTGFEPADAVLAHIEAHPGQSMIRLFQTAPVTVLDLVATDLVGTARSGRLLRPRTAVFLDPTVVSTQRAIVALATDTGRVPNVATAAIAVLAGALDLTTTDKRDALLTRCGSVRSLVADCACYLDQLMERSTLVAALSGAAAGSSG